MESSGKTPNRGDEIQSHLLLPDCLVFFCLDFKANVFSPQKKKKKELVFKHPN